MEQLCLELGSDETRQDTDNDVDTSENNVQGIAERVDLPAEFGKLLGFGGGGVASGDADGRRSPSVFGQKYLADMETWSCSSSQPIVV